MRGLGTIINVGCILLGGVCGLGFGRFIGEKLRQTLMVITGVAVMMLGAGGTMSRMLSVTADGIGTTGSMMMIVCLVIGAVVGELLDIDGAIARFGEWLKRKSGSESDASFVGAFVSASCTVCIGAMAVVGAMQDGLSGDYTVLLAKGILDAVIICVMTSAQGRGCVFSAIPVAIFQGAVTLTAVFAGVFMTQPALDNLSYVGSVLIFCVGLNLTFDTKIRVSNLLPALVAAAVWGFVG